MLDSGHCLIIIVEMLMFTFDLSTNQPILLSLSLAHTHTHTHTHIISLFLISLSFSRFFLSLSPHSFTRFLLKNFHWKNLISKSEIEPGTGDTNIGSLSKIKWLLKYFYKYIAFDLKHMNHFRRICRGYLNVR